MKQTSYGCDLNSSPSGCSKGLFPATGDRLATSADPMKDLGAMYPRRTGSETVNGFATKVTETAKGSDDAKIWLDAKSGLVVKALLGGWLPKRHAEKMACVNLSDWCILAGKLLVPSGVGSQKTG
jgi:hypothetical protein